MWIWVLAGIAILGILIYYNRREHMTNDQLISTLKTFGDQGTFSSKSGGQSVKPIYGPSANPPPIPTNTGGGMNGRTVAGPYPQIFGPDVTNAPGTTRSFGRSGGDLSGDGSGSGGGAGTCNSSSGKVISDEPPPYESHEFNPDLAKAFPVDGPPQPFLTDFSRIQH